MRFRRKQGGKFLKVRVTTLESDFEDHQAEIEKFLTQVSQAFQAEARRKSPPARRLHLQQDYGFLTGF